MASTTKKNKRTSDDGPQGSHFTLRFSPEDRARLRSIEEHYAINGTSVIRMLLKREADAIALQAPERAKRLGRTG